MRDLSGGAGAQLAVTTVLPANPSGVNNATGLMAGLAVSFTPAASGRVLVVVSLNWNNGSTGSVASFQIRYGTGTAPTNGAALTGSTAGSLISNRSPNGTDPQAGAASGTATGLSVGTTYWFDLSQASDGGSTTTLTNISYTIVEI